MSIWKVLECALIGLPVEELYQDDPRVWNAIFEIVIAHLSSCEKDGIDLGGQQGRLFPIVLANKGDWSYLVPGMKLGLFWLIDYRSQFLQHKRAGLIYHQNSSYTSQGLSKLYIILLLTTYNNISQIYLCCPNCMCNMCMF